MRTTTGAIDPGPASQTGWTARRAPSPLTWTPIAAEVIYDLFGIRKWESAVVDTNDVWYTMKEKSIPSTTGWSRVMTRADIDGFRERCEGRRLEDVGRMALALRYQPWGGGSILLLYVVWDMELLWEAGQG